MRLCGGIERQIGELTVDNTKCLTKGVGFKKIHTFLINMYRSSGISGARPVFHRHKTSLCQSMKTKQRQKKTSYLAHKRGRVDVEDLVLNPPRRRG